MDLNICCFGRHKLFRFSHHCCDLIRGRAGNCNSQQVWVTDTLYMKQCGKPNISPDKHLEHHFAQIFQPYNYLELGTSGDVLSAR